MRPTEIAIVVAIIVVVVIAAIVLLGPQIAANPGGQLVPNMFLHLTK